MTTFVLPRFAAVFRASNVPLPPTTLFVHGIERIPRQAFCVDRAWGSLGCLWGASGCSTIRQYEITVTRCAFEGAAAGADAEAGVCLPIDSDAGDADQSGIASGGCVGSDAGHDAQHLLLAVFSIVLRAHIGEGKQLSGDFESTTLFPPMVTQMMSVGEQTGTLSQVCLEIASFHEEELQERIKVLTTALEPLIIVMLGGFVGFIAISVILPMFKLSSTVH